MNLSGWSRKQIGALGERAAAEYLRRNGFSVLDTNVARKTGELDLVAIKRTTLHVVEVKSVACDEFPAPDITESTLFNPTENLHPAKLRKVVRTGQWYIAEKHWEGEWQVDGIVVWLRRRDGIARVRYLPQLV
ncbi:MAG TPA: YraN family protein [Candidatus Paceibacterota bacterium]|nr:YraN family protein [Candidatus Paceibacterota bacterium]